MCVVCVCVVRCVWCVCGVSVNVTIHFYFTHSPHMHPHPLTGSDAVTLCGSSVCDVEVKSDTISELLRLYLGEREGGGVDHVSVEREGGGVDHVSVERGEGRGGGSKSK